MTQYDIFISYRRDTGAQYARILQLMLQQRGYHVFLDYDELIDGEFNRNIEHAVRQSPVFMLVLSKDSLDRCVNDGDWVRRELEMAVGLDKHIIPVNADNTFERLPKGLPPVIEQCVRDLQRSDVRFGQMLRNDVDFLIENRIAPHIGKRRRQKQLDDGETIRTRLREDDERERRRRKRRRILVRTVAIVAVLALVAGLIALGRHWRLEKQRDALMADSLAGLRVYWADGISLRELRALHSIADSLVLVNGGSFTMGAWPDSSGAYSSLINEELELPARSVTVASFLMGKVEVSIGEWNAIMGIKCAPDSANLPKANVSFADCKEFCDRLFALTKIEFRMPTEEEWEYAARGGSLPDSSLFAGPRGKAPDDVAWYAKNSGNRPHPRDHTHDALWPNGANLYDMSGNVAEWCNTPFRLYADAIEPEAEILDSNAMTVRGGSFQSSKAEITVSHRDLMNAQERVATVGLRLVVDCQ